MGIKVKPVATDSIHTDTIFDSRNLKPMRSNGQVGLYRYTSHNTPELIVNPRDVCQECYREIKTMAYQGTGACCELCRKALAGEK